MRTSERTKGMGYALTADERTGLTWPQRYALAQQRDQERAERAAQAAAAEDRRRYEETLAYAAHTQRRSDEETRNHRTGMPCDPMFCRFDHS